MCAKANVECAEKAREEYMRVNSEHIDLDDDEGWKDIREVADIVSGILDAKKELEEAEKGVMGCQTSVK
jgi:hypothetical protein